MTLTPDPPTINVNCVKTQPGDANGLLTANHFEPTTNQFTVPLIGSSTTLNVILSTQYALGMFVFVGTAGYFEITGILSAITLSVTNQGTTGNSTPGFVAPIGSIIIADAPPEGAAASTFALYDTLAQVFTTPTGATPASMFINDASWPILGLKIYLHNAGWYDITAIDTTAKRLTVVNADDQNVGGGNSFAIGAPLYPEKAPTFNLGRGLGYSASSTFFGDVLSVLATVPLTPTLSNANILTGRETDLSMTTVTDDENLATVSIVDGGFTVEPVIILTMAKDDDMGELFSLYVRNRSNTSFDIFGSNNFPGGETVDVNWLAIGI